MNGKAVFIDLSKCIGCRGCQVACKQWNQLPGEKTINTGSYQNPKDFSASTYTIVRFNETEKNDKIVWTFFKDQCRHCVEPPCESAADDYAPGSITINNNGAVVYTADTKKFGTEDLSEFCPYNIPRKSEKSGEWYKCTFCDDRIANGLEPACVKACPTGTLIFGDRDVVMLKAKKRLNQIKKDYPKASLLDFEDVRWIYLLHESEDSFQISERKTGRFDRYSWRNLLKPQAPLVFIAGALALLFKKREQRIEEK